MSDFTSKLMKDYGDNILVNGSSILDEDVKILPVSPAINVLLGGGVPEGSWMNLSSKFGVGKEQPISAVVYTPTGPKQIGSLIRGDLVCTPEGKITRVTNVYPQGIKDVYRITLDTKEYVECGIDHLWEVYCRYDKKNNLLSLKDILCDDYVNRHGGKKYGIDTINYCFFDKKEIQFDPYLLGLLIGDGSFLHRQLRFTSTDQELLDYISNSLDKDYELKPVTSKVKTIDYRISRKYNKPHIYINLLKKMGLYGKKSLEKFIPDIYKYNSKQIRIDILQGLFDTDASVAGKSKICIEYSTSSLQLAQDVKEIVNSLGGLCSVVERYTKCNDKLFKSYRCVIQYYDCSLLFRLKRKVNRCVLKTKYSIFRRYITKIEIVRQEECVCIQLDSKEGLYITDNYIKTHNTTTALHFAANCQKPENGSREIFYLDIEGRLKKRNLQGIKGLDLKKFHAIRSSEEKILSAQDFLTIGEEILKDKKQCVLIIDSYSALCHENEMTGGIGTSTRGAGAYQLLAGFCRQMSQVVPVRKHVVIGIVQMMANVSGYGAATVEKGGNAIAYQADIFLRAKSMKPWEATIGGKQIGQIVEWHVVKAALHGGFSGASAESYIRYGIGIDTLRELIGFATDIGLMRQGGAWYYCDFMENHLDLLGVSTWDDDTKKLCKCQGEAKMYAMLESHPDWLIALEKDILKLTVGK